MWFVLFRNLWIVAKEEIMAKLSKKKVTPRQQLPRKVYRKKIEHYANSRGVEFRKGDLVKLNTRALKLYKKTEDETFAGLSILQARIYSLLPDAIGMVVLEQRLGGYWTWPVSDLENITRP